MSRRPDTLETDLGNKLEDLAEHMDCLAVSGGPRAMAELARISDRLERAAWKARHRGLTSNTARVLWLQAMGAAADYFRLSAEAVSMTAGRMKRLQGKEAADRAIDLAERMG